MTATQSDGNRRPRKPTQHGSELTTKERQALELRLAGARFEDIAVRVGYADKSGAQRAVTRALTSTLQPAADELREVEASRLDRLLLSVWQQALAGDLKAVDRALRILDQRARLLGLNLPARAELDVTVSPAEEIEVVRRIREWKAARDQEASAG